MFEFLPHYFTTVVAINSVGDDRSVSKWWCKYKHSPDVVRL